MANENPDNVLAVGAAVAGAGPAMEGLKELHTQLLKRHGPVHDSCLAKLGHEIGVLGFSTIAYTRVWFDTKDDSKTLFWSFSVEECRAKYAEFKSKIAL